MAVIVKTLEPSGILDGVTTNELKSQISDFFREDAEIFILDMKDVTFMNSSGIGALVAILKMIRAKEKQLYLCGLTDQVKMIFKLTKMERVFKIFGSREEFDENVIK